MRDWLIRLTAVVGVVAIGVLLFRFATATESTSHRDNSLEQVRAMLRDRALKLTHGDVESFLRVDTPEGRVLEEPLARGTRQVPLADVHITVEPLRTMDVSGSSFKDILTTFVYNYKDLAADNHFEFIYLSTIERQGTSWLVTGARLKPQEPRYDPRLNPPIWATGPVKVDRSGHFLTLYRPDLRNERNVVALAELARARLAPKVLLDFDSNHLLLLAADGKQYGEMSGDTKLATSLGAAFFYFTGDPVSGLQLPADRYMVIDTTAVLTSAGTPLHGVERSPTEILQHELGHLALFRYMTPDTPTWVNEGGAMFLADERRQSEWRGLVANNFEGQTIKMFEDEWERGVEPLPANEYPYSNAAVLAMVEKLGPKQWFDSFKGYKFVRDYRGGLQQAKDKPTEIILQRFYKFGREDLDVLTRDYIRRAVGAQ